WVGNGPNRPISPGDLSKVLDTDQINTLMSQSGLSRDELLAGLSDHLPRLVDHLTPNGRMPTDEEMSRIVWDEDHLIAEFPWRTVKSIERFPLSVAHVGAAWRYDGRRYTPTLRRGNRGVPHNVPRRHPLWRP